MLLAVGLLIASSTSGAQPHGPYRIGFLSPATASSMAPRLDAFKRGLVELGYVEGRTIVIDYRWGEGKEGRLPGLAQELVRLKVDVLLVHGVAATQAARKASAALPIVCFACGDLVSTGVVASLSRPQGNITGLTILAPEVSGKRLELLREIVPGLARVAVLWNALNPVSVPELKETQAAAQALGLAALSFSVKGPQDLERAFSEIRQTGADALVVLSDAMLYGQRARIADLAVASRLPSVSWTGEFAKSGGLIGYGPDVFAIARRAATYVDKIAKGAKPADLPIEQPDKFEFVLNASTAKALGLEIPQSLLVRADEVVQ